jgi:hypothetical protein
VRLGYMTPSSDRAAILGMAMSLMELIEADHFLVDTLERHYGGYVAVMGVVMHAAESFEAWADSRVDFDALDIAWPYLVRAEFGEAYAKGPGLLSLDKGEALDCLSVANQMRLPLIDRTCCLV